MKTYRIPSKYQATIYGEYKTTDHNIVIEAGPGTGKSTIITDLLKFTPLHLRAIVVAFNKSIADELTTKVASHVKVSTIHSLAYSVLRQNMTKNFKVNSFKNFILGRKNLGLKHLKPKQVDGYLFLISKIIDLSRLNMCQTQADIESICAQYNVSTVNGEIKDVMTMLGVLDKYNSSSPKEYMIDFTDMLHLAVTKVKAIDFPKYNVVFCDELQDLNPLQKEIVERVIHPVKGRFIGVGDFKQSIYGFMGANPESFKSFINRPNTVTLPLSVTYRCSHKITEEANKIFPGLECFESNIEGSVTWGELDKVEEGDFVICRNNLPLIEAFIDILKQGKQCHILGKDFGQNLLTIIEKIARFPDFGTGCDEVLRQKADKLREKGITKPEATSSYGELREKVLIIKILKLSYGSFDSLETAINRIFSDDDKKGIILMTIHKSKGLETNRVFFLQPDLLPSKYAQTELELYQEKCLEFVVTTRARHHLVYVANV